MIDQVATISSNNDTELGKLIGGAFKSVANTGVVMMEESRDNLLLLKCRWYAISQAS